MNNWQSTADKLGGVSRTMVFKLWASGELGSVTIGTRRFSTDNQISDYIGSREAAAALVPAGD
jgi:hypothetical protein